MAAPTAHPQFQDILTSPAVSVVMPVFQEEHNAAGCLLETIGALEAEGLSYEIVAVDDGSLDNTFDALRSVQQEHPQVRIARHVHNKGNGAALRTGIRLARGEVIVCMDADGQHSPGDIPALLACIPPYDMVVGSRTSSYQGAWYRNIANRFYNRFSSWLTHTQILDLTSGFRAMRREAVTHFLPLYPAGFSAPTTVTMAFLKAGYSIKYLPIQVRPRARGKSKINLFQDGSRFVMIMLKIIMLYDPLRIFLPVAGLLTLLALAGMVAGILAAGRLVVPGSAVVLFISALLSLLLGLVSSQISSANIHYFGDELVNVYEAQVDKPTADARHQ